MSVACQSSDSQTSWSFWLVKWLGGAIQFFTLAQCTTFRDHQRPGMWYAFSSTIFWSSMTSFRRSTGSSVRACRE